MERIAQLSICALIFSLLTGCATLPPSTGFTPAAGIDKYGYAVKELEAGQHSYMSIYRGNSRTKTSAAMAYTVLAAYEHCRNDQKTALATMPENLSVNETHTNLGSYSVPTYSGKGQTSYQTHYYSYPVTTTYPQFFSVFVCRTSFKSFVSSAKFEKVSAELVHDLTQDFHGGLIVKSVDDEHKGKPFQVDDVLIRIGSKRLESGLAIGELLEGATGQSVPVEIIRNHRIVKARAAIVENTDAIQKLEISMTKKLCTYIPAEEAADTGHRQTREVQAPSICVGQENVSSTK